MKESEIGDYEKNKELKMIITADFKKKKAHHDPGIVLSTLHKPSHLILTIICEVFTILEMLANIQCCTD